MKKKKINSEITGFSDTYKFEYDENLITEKQMIRKLKTVGKSVDSLPPDVVDLGSSTRYRVNYKKAVISGPTIKSRNYKFDSTTKKVYAQIVTYKLPFPKWHDLGVIR